MSKPTDQPPRQKKQVFLIDDHEVPRQGFAALINKQPDLQVCGQAGNSAEALDLLKTCNPTLIISDLSLPGTSGVDLVKLLVSHYPDIPLLVFTMHDEDAYGERILRAGARGYVMKSEPFKNVMEAIHEVLGGERFLSKNMQEILLTKFLNKGSGQRSNGNMIDRLTDRELEIVQLIGQGLKSSQIAARLGISVKTIESHRENIKSKLNLKSSVELTRFAFQWCNTHNGL